MSLSRAISYLKTEVDANVLDPGVDVGVHLHVFNTRGSFEGGSQPRHLETSKQLNSSSVLTHHHHASYNSKYSSHLPVHHHGARPHYPAEASQHPLGEADLSTEQSGALSTQRT